MELFEEAKKLGVPDIDITEDEWRDEYSKLYSVTALGGSFLDKIIAAEDIIKTYLVLQARKINTLAPDACPTCNGLGIVKDSRGRLGDDCLDCSGSGIRR